MMVEALSASVGIAKTFEKSRGGVFTKKLSKSKSVAEPVPREIPASPPVRIAVSLRAIAYAGVRSHVPLERKYWPVSERYTCT